MAPPNGDSGGSQSGASSRRQNKRIKKKNGANIQNGVTPLAPPPRKSLIRKRPVTFGNPALGTYHGCLYTLDVIGEDYCPISRPIIEGAESIERVVAMVDVPPEQVPEGMLNLARSHRPYLLHVRIVIAENNEEYQLEKVGSTLSPRDKTEGMEEQMPMGQEETKDEFDDEEFGQTPQSTSRRTTTLETSPHLIPTEEVVSSVNASAKEPVDAGTMAEVEEDVTNPNGQREDVDAFSAPSRTYLVLLELSSVEAAEDLVEDLHRKPYTSLDPSQKCSVHHVLALSGEDGVSLLSPFFAPSAKSSSPKANVNSTASLHSNGSPSAGGTTGQVASGMTNQHSSTAGKAISVKTTTTSQRTTSEDYNCAVCLDHMILNGSENDDNGSNRSSILTTVCNHTFHLDCLLQWQDSPCPVCRYDHSGLNEALSQCHLCGRTENNYVCLICGVVSCGGPPLLPAGGALLQSTGIDSLNSDSLVCGSEKMAPPTTAAVTRLGNPALTPIENSAQLSQSHARNHYDQTLHAYALDTETQHVWDFAGQGYVHRLLQNKEDGKLVEVHDPSNTTSHERSTTPGLSEAQEGEVVHRKLEGFASQYYTLLKSQLEQQRIYYEGRLEELRRESLVKKKAQTSDLINALKQEKAQLSKRLASLKERHSKVEEDVGFLKSMNESLRANEEPLRLKIKEAQRQRSEEREQAKQRMAVLEAKLTSLLEELTGEPVANDSTDEIADGTNETGGSSPGSVNPKEFERSDSSLGEDRKPAARG